MATNRHLTSVLAVLAIACVGGPTLELQLLEGKQPRQKPSSKPTVRASFPRESYRAGESARLIVASRATGLEIRIFRAGAEDASILANDLMLGRPVTEGVPLARTRVGQGVRLSLGDWPSGFYFARLSTDRGQVGYAPFVVRPKHLGENRVAVVLPTQTWQAYNFSDDGTWYAGGSTARTGRPFENRGVPTHYKRYDQPFLRWLAKTGREVDYLAQADLNQLSGGRALAAAYDLIVFPGHHEYVTEREYDAIEQYRDLGGNLAFLSANNFFWKVTRRGDLMTRVKQWRDLGRPESALIGVQYFANDDGSHRNQWIVKNPHAANGLFASAGLAKGDGLGIAGIEVDGVTSHSPPNIKVLAEVAWRRGKTAHMTYYVTPGGSKVFAAGAFTVAGQAMDPELAPFLQELWSRLARP